jgi:hypothetical protein
VEPPVERDRKRFPLLDTEEPPRSWWRRLAVPAAVIVVVLLAAGGVALVRSLSQQAPSHAPPSLAVRIAVVTEALEITSQPALAAGAGGPARPDR